MSKFTDEFIKKWEAHYGNQHRGLIEISKEPKQDLIYYDNVFVEDLLKYAGKLYQKSETMKNQALDILKELKDEKTSTTLKGVAKEISRLADTKDTEVGSVASSGPVQKKEDKKEGPGNGAPPGGADLRGGRKGVSKGVPV